MGLRPMVGLHPMAASYVLFAALLFLMLSAAQPAFSTTATVGGGAASGLLASDRDATGNWKNAGLLSVGGIPHRTTVCATISPLGGGKSDTTHIQNAITACPIGQVVQLAAGAFTIAEGNYILINKAISLRGAGAGSTILQRPNGSQLEPGEATGSSPSPLVILGPSRWGPWFGNPDQSTNSVNLTADGAAGSTSITLNCGGNCSSTFSVGQIVLLDEVSGAGWQPDVTGSATSVWASPDYRVTYKKHNPSFSFDDFSATQYPYQAGTNGDQYSRLDRVTNEIKEITSISGNTVTFSSPLTISYRVSHTAQLTWLSNSSSRAHIAHVKNAGLESLSVRNGDDGAIKFNWCAYCWAKKIENSIWSGQGIRFYNSFRCELREFYTHDAAYSQPGGGAYAIALDGASSEILVEDGISIRTDKAIVARASGAGSVVGYNYMDMGFIDYSEAWIETGLNASHFVGSHHVLFEGNYGFNADSDNTHGSSVYMTYFRNWLAGIRHSFVNPKTGDTVNDASQPGNGPKRTVGPMSYSYWQTFVGNVLGISGQMGGWTYQGDLTRHPTVWALGWGDVDANGVWHVDQQITNSAFPGHIVRDGNWDWVSSSQKWDDTPATIPNSLYRTSAPAFFGSNPWPWVSPATGAVNTLPAKSRFDNGTPNAP